MRRRLTFAPMTTADDARRKRHRRRRLLYRLRQYAIEALALAVLVAAVAVPVTLLRRRRLRARVPEQTAAPTAVDTAQTPVWEFPHATADTYTLTDEVDAASAILVDVTQNTVVAAKEPTAVLYPASTTKIMTLLVAVEHIADFSDTFTMTYEILHPLYLNQATIAGFLEGEAVTLEDLLYGTILPSGADAAQALAEYVAGSEKAFVQMMNDKAAELGLQNTHFTNTSGLHDAQHYTTAQDTAMMLLAAMRNDHCRKVLSTYQYTTAATPEHPEGIALTSTMFSRMYGDEPDGAQVVAGKTGFTDQAGNTMASYAEGENGHDYIFVSLKGTNRWGSIFDAIHMYSRFCPEMPETSNAG